MSIENYPIIDTTEIDLLVSSYAMVQNSANPMDLLDYSPRGFSVEEEMLGLIRESAMSFAGKAVLASAQFAIGMDSLDEINPAISVADGACSFAGRVVDIAVCDFTDAMKKAEMIKNNNSRVCLPGIVFETVEEIEDFAPSLGIVSLAPYCAVLPGSPYELRHIPFVW